MGRPAKSTERHVDEGTFRADRHGGRKNKPKFDGAPTRPTALSAEGKKHWDQIVPQLVTSGVAKAIDAPALFAMCEAWADYQKARTLRVYDIDDMRKKQMLVSSSLKAWRDLAARFGMTPIDREKIEVAADDKEGNPLKAFFGEALKGGKSA